MHTFQHQGCAINHNNDIRSDAHVYVHALDGKVIAIPQPVLVAFVAYLVANEKIAELEQAEPLEVLGLSPAALTPGLLNEINAAARAMAAAADLIMSLPGGHQFEADELDAARTALLQALP